MELDCNQGWCVSSHIKLFWPGNEIIIGIWHHVQEEQAGVDNDIDPIVSAYFQRKKINNNSNVHMDKFAKACTYTQTRTKNKWNESKRQKRQKQTSMHWNKYI